MLVRKLTSESYAEMVGKVNMSRTKCKGLVLENKYAYDGIPRD